MVELEVEAAVERWITTRDALVDAKFAADTAAKRVQELAVEQGLAAEVLGKRVGANITRRIHKAKDGRIVLVAWHSNSFVEVSSHNIE